MRSVMLACSRFHGRHSGEIIAQQVEEILTCFDITDKVTNIITDNISNMLKAFSLPGFEADVPTNSDEDEDPDSNPTESHDITDEIIAAEHEPCFAHTLQLVNIKDGMKQAGPINKVLGKAANIVSHVQCSTHPTEILDGERKLQAANATRSQNSQLTMVRSLLRAPEEKLQQPHTFLKN